MKNRLVYLSLFAGLAIGLSIGWLANADRGINAIQNVVAMSWGDGKYGKAFYGAEVFLEPIGKRYTVQVRVWIGRGNNFWHGPIDLGVVEKPEQAVARWGQIEWSDAGLTIGPGDPEPYFLSREKLERHR